MFALEFISISVQTLKKTASYTSFCEKTISLNWGCPALTCTTQNFGSGSDLLKIKFQENSFFCLGNYDFLAYIYNFFDPGKYWRLAEWPFKDYENSCSSPEGDHTFLLAAGYSFLFEASTRFTWQPFCLCVILTLKLEVVFTSIIAKAQPVMTKIISAAVLPPGHCQIV